MKPIVKILAIVLVVVMGTATTVQNIDSDKYFEIIKNIEIFTNLYKEVNTYYVDDLDPGQLMRTGIDAMTESLDPFTNYISESDIEGYRFMTEGRYSGIGAMSQKMGEYVTITELYKDQPADQAGLIPGDQIIAIDGKSAKGRRPEDINDILRGFPGTEVTMTIKRPGTEKDFDVKLVRGEVNVPNVPYYGMINEDVGYVSLTTFTREAGRNVANAVKELKAEHPNIKGVIFDLRGNGGGLLTEAVNVSNVFIPKGELVVTTKGKVKEWDRSFKTLNSPIDQEIPLVVLINKNSASASEIVSGVIQDYDRGILLGQRSYGKGLVQNTRDIGYNAKVKMTTAKYYIPSQRCIQSVEYKNGEPVDISDEKRAIFKTRNGRTVLDGGGVSPDVKVKKPTEEGVLKSLMDQHLVFDYVTQYCLENEEIAAPEDYHFKEFEDFITFLSERNFVYDSESEALLRELMEESQAEGFDVAKELKALEAKMEQTKKDEIRRHQEEIIDMIEKEIASRYYYHEGKIKMGLRNDEEIDQAVQILRDDTKYQGILTAGK